MTDFLDRAITKLFYNNKEGSASFALVSIAQELRLMRQQLGHVMGQLVNSPRMTKDDTQKQDMVVGFVFYPSSSVYLIRKSRPKWQSGKLNGIGGHIEENETPIEAMRRECKEEGGLDISDWTPICTMGGDDWNLHIFATIISALDELKTMTDEEIELHSMDNLRYERIIPNLHFLVPMAWEHMHNQYTFKKAVFRY